jgi:hypothetical protein
MYMAAAITVQWMRSSDARTTLGWSSHRFKHPLDNAASAW